jgi:hypothetical protein
MSNIIPGSKQIFIRFFLFFINMDRLWLYAYQSRNYGIEIKKIFSSVI